MHAEPTNSNAIGGGLTGKGSSMDRPIKPRFWNLPRLVILISLAGSLIAFLVLARNLSRPSLLIEPKKLTISTVIRASFQEFTPVSGKVLPSKVFYLETIEGGRVEEIYMEEGSVVQRGTTILRLANTDLQLAIMNRRDQLTEQINRLVNARLAFEQQDHEHQRRLAELEHDVLKQRRLYERDSNLRQEGLIPQIEYELSKAEYEFLQEKQKMELEREKSNNRFRQEQLKQLKQAVESMQQNLSVAREKLAKLNLQAPADGQLTSLDAEIGQSKAPGERIGQLDVLDDFKVRARVDQNYIARVNLDQLATFELMDETYSLLVEKIYPEVEQGKFEIDLRFLDRPPVGIKRGQNLQVRLMVGAASEAMVLDVGPFFQTTGGQWVYVVDPNNNGATRRTIRLGRKNTEHFEILDGLQLGDRVITSGYRNFERYERIVFKE